MKLVGKKLYNPIQLKPYRTGPLRLFNMPGNPGESSYQNPYSQSPPPSRNRGPSDAEKRRQAAERHQAEQRRKAEEAARQAQAQKERDEKQAEARRQYELEKEAEARAAAKKAEQDKREAEKQAERERQAAAEKDKRQQAARDKYKADIDKQPKREPRTTNHPGEVEQIEIEYKQKMNEYISNMSPTERANRREGLLQFKNAGGKLDEESQELEKGLDDFRNKNEQRKRDEVKKLKQTEKELLNKLKKIPIRLAQALGLWLGKKAVMIDKMITGGELTQATMDKMKEFMESGGPLEPGNTEVTDKEIDDYLANEDHGLDNPNDPDKYDGSPHQLQNNPKPGDPHVPPKTPQPSGKPVMPEGPLGPPAGEKLDPEIKDIQSSISGSTDDRRERLLDRLEAIATGKDSLAVKQAKTAREESLKQRLAQMQSMRGAPIAAQMRQFSRAQDAASRELAEQAPKLTIQERKEADYLLSTMLEGSENRELQIQLEKMSLADKQKLREMKRDEAIRQGQEKMWLMVAKESWNLFGSDIKKWYKESDFFGTDTNVSFDDEDTFDVIFSPGGHNTFGSYEDFENWQKSQAAAEGGYISGPGTETSDSIPAKLSDGEFVIKAEAVRGLGKSLGALPGEERQKGVDFLYQLQDKMAQNARVSDGQKKKLFNKLVEDKKFSKGGEAYSRPKKAFREAIGYEAESRFHDKALKDTKFGGARRKFYHYQDGGPVDLTFKPQFKPPRPTGYGSVVAAQQDFSRRLEELERKMGR